MLHLGRDPEVLAGGDDGDAGGGAGSGDVGVTAGGLVLAVALGRTLEALLFEVTPFDAHTFAAAAAAQLAVSVAAHYGPVRRALHIDPAESLRQQ